MEENGDMHERLLLAPMVKAAVLAMNATDDILHQEDCGIGPSAKKCRTSDVRYNLYGKLKSNRYFSVNRWALTGGSKRGWTAWLAAAVDYHRVKLTAPVVLSFLNMVENFHHYWRYFNSFKSEQTINLH